MSSSLVVSTSDGQRYSVKVTPMMPLASVLEQACQYFKLGDVNRWQLSKDNKTTLDLSLTVRFANLPNGSKLLLVPKKYKQTNNSQDAMMIQVALQLPEGGRVVGTFHKNTVLWNILEHFETTSNGVLNLTKKTGPPSKNYKNPFKSSVPTPEYMIPALLIMNREVNNLNDLQSTTLASLGLDKSIIFRLIFKHSGKTLEECFPVSSNSTSDITSTSSETLEPSLSSFSTAPLDPSFSTSVPSTSSTEIPSTAESIPSSSTATSTTSSATTDAPSALASNLVVSSEKPTSVSDPMVEESLELNREFILFAPPTESSILSVQLPDDFFQLTPLELRAYAALIKKKRSDLENQPLKTQAMRDKEEALKKAKFPKTLIRIKFHDSYQLQFQMLSSEPVSLLYQLVSSQFQSILTSDFELYQMVPRKQVLHSQGTIYEAGLTPASVLHCSLTDLPTPSLLRPELISSIQSLPVTTDISSSVSHSEPAVSNTESIATEPNESPIEAHSLYSSSSSSSSSSSTERISNLDSSTSRKDKGSLHSKFSKFIRLGKKI